MEKFPVLAAVLLIFGMLCGFFGCATVVDTPGNDPEPLQAMIYQTPKPGEVYCGYSRITLEETQLKVSCAGVFGDLGVRYVDDATEERLELVFLDKEAPQFIVYVDNTGATRRDGKAAVRIDTVVVHDKFSGSRNRSPVVSDQHIFDRWLAIIRANAVNYEMTLSGGVVGVDLDDDP